MKNEILVDTNMLVYYVLGDSVFHSLAKRFLEDSDAILCTTSKNLSEFLAATTKGSEPMLSQAEALAHLRKFRQALRILYADERSSKQVENWLERHQIKGMQIHDAEIAAIGLVQGISTIVTLNTDDFKRFEEITLLTP
jgi:predicted nucleic acid-binding protein